VEAQGFELQQQLNCFIWKSRIFRNSVFFKFKKSVLDKTSYIVDVNDISIIYYDSSESMIDSIIYNGSFKLMAVVHKQ
jgi:hypothetical protein